MAAFIFSLVFMLLTAVAAPFGDVSDDYFAKACGFALSAVLFFSVILKVRAACAMAAHTFFPIAAWLVSSAGGRTG